MKKEVRGGGGVVMWAGRKVKMRAWRRGCQRGRGKPRETVPTGELVEGGKENAKFRGRARGPLQEAEKTEKAARGEGFKHDR